MTLKCVSSCCRCLLLAIQIHYDYSYRTVAQLFTTFVLIQIFCTISCSILSGVNSVIDEKQILFYALGRKYLCFTQAVSTSNEA